MYLFALFSNSWCDTENITDDRLRAVPQRAPSTEWTRLESGLDYWRQEHSRPYQDDSVFLSKVRYNDTGSLEEVCNLVQGGSIINTVHTIKYFLIFRQYNIRKDI